MFEFWRYGPALFFLLNLFHLSPVKMPSFSFSLILSSTSSSSSSSSSSSIPQHQQLETNTIPCPPLQLQGPLSPASPPLHILGRNQHSIAFYIPLNNSSGSNNFTSSSNSNNNDNSVFKFKTRKSSIMGSSHRHLLSSARHSQATMKRFILASEKRHCLKQRAERIKYRVFLARQRQNMHRLQMRARADYAMAAATMRRQRITKLRREKWAAHVEHVHSVVMIQKVPCLNNHGGSLLANHPVSPSSRCANTWILELS